MSDDVALAYANGPKQEQKKKKNKKKSKTMTKSGGDSATLRVRTSCDAGVEVVPPR